MAENSAIEWTTHTFNPWRGCTKVAAGCANCYADTLSKRNPKTLGIWGPNGKRVLAGEKYWRQPLKWNRDAEGASERPRVFCASLADVFEHWGGPMYDTDGEPAFDRDQSAIQMADARRMLFDLIDATPNLDWLLVTKRPENLRRMWVPRFVPGERADSVAVYRDYPNVWLLTSIATQEDADRNIPELLKCRDLVPVLGLSAEPLLGAIDLGLDRIWCRHHQRFEDAACMDESQPCFRWQALVRDMLDWVIAGGESGANARPMHPDWARSLRDQCTAAGVPFFFKQWGEWKPISEMVEAEWSPYYVSNRRAKRHEDQAALDDVYGTRCTIPTETIRYDGEHGNGLNMFEWIDGHFGYQTFGVGKKAAGRLLDGREWNEYPQPTLAM